MTCVVELAACCGCRVAPQHQSVGPVPHPALLDPELDDSAARESSCRGAAAVLLKRVCSSLDDRFALDELFASAAGHDCGRRASRQAPVVPGASAGRAQLDIGRFDGVGHTQRQRALETFPSSRTLPGRGRERRERPLIVGASTPIRRTGAARRGEIRDVPGAFAERARISIR